MVGDPEPTALQVEGRATGRPAAFFDLDKTIIAKSSTLAFSKPFQAGGLISRRAVLRSAYAQFVYLVGGADHDQMEKMREFLSDLCAGWDVQTVRDIVADTLHNVVDPLVFDEAVSLIEEHHLAGRDVIIVSASGTEVVEPIGEMLGADGVVATRMRIEDGRYTGEIDYYAYGENKATAIRDLAERHGYDLSRSYAYSDSVTDLAMLEEVGHPHAVNPDRELRRQATQRGWPVLVFTRQVTLHSRMRLPQSGTTLAALALGTAAAVGGAVYVAARRRLTGSP
jgi:HAD superfamily hydrolase (TIGR01490 family)